MTENPQPPPDDESSGNTPEVLPQHEAEPSVDSVLASTKPRFARGEALASVEAGEIAAECRATVVVLAGSQGSGKTTLLASLYDQLGRGPFGGHLFLGSRTLAGFDRRSSQAGRPHKSVVALKGRTSPQPPPWLHLRLRRAENRRRVDLLLGDFPGEDFVALADGIQRAEDNFAFWRADHIGIVIHGGRLARLESRTGEQRDIRDILKALLATRGAMVGPEALTFIVSMWDLVDTAEGATEAADQVVDELQELVRREYPAHEQAVAVIRTAARSSNEDQIPAGHGVDDLLIRWSDRPSLPFPNETPTEESVQ